ncbi:hypothetical protein H8959_006533 [Pygathrix nigripes]
MESKACESNNEDILSSSGVTSNEENLLNLPTIATLLSVIMLLSLGIKITLVPSCTVSFCGVGACHTFYRKSEKPNPYQADCLPRYSVGCCKIFNLLGKIIQYPGKEHFERVLEEYSHQVKDLQRRLNESNELHEKQKFYLRQSVIDLQTKLQEMQMERDAMADIRRRESQSQEDLRNQLQNTVHELEAAKCLKEDMLKDSNTQIEQLRKMMLSHEGVLQEIRSILVDFEEASGKKIYEHDSMSTLHFRSLGSAISKILRELDTEISFLKGRIFPVEDQLEALKSESQNKMELLLQQHQDRIEQLISEHEVEITGLTEKASSARSQANSIQSQMEIIQEQARNQNSMYMRQLSDLESTVSQLRSELREAKRMYEDKENLQNSPLRIWTSRSCHYWLCRFGFTLNFRFFDNKCPDLD